MWVTDYGRYISGSVFGVLGDEWVEAGASPEAPTWDQRRKIKRMVLRAMLARFVLEGIIRPDDSEDVLRAILRREELGTTGVGRGLAVPHTRHPCADRVYSGWFTADPPAPFDAIDLEPVWLFNVLISPLDRPGDHLRWLEAAVLFRNSFGDDHRLCSAVRSCRRNDQLRQVLCSLAEGNQDAVIEP